MSEQPANAGLDAPPARLKSLAEFEGCDRNAQLHGILFNLADYLELVDTAGRVLLDDKRGAIPMHLLAIFQRLGINHSRWLQQCTEKVPEPAFVSMPLSLAT